MGQAEDDDKDSTASRNLSQRHHSAPELRLVADVHVVFVDKCELAVRADTKDGEACAQSLDCGTIANGKRLQTGGDEHSSAGIQRESARLDSTCVDVLDESGLTCFVNDRKDGDAVLTTREYIFTLELDGRRRTIGLIDESSIRMHVNRACALTEHRLRVRQRFFYKQRLAGEAGRRVSSIDVEFVLALDGDIYPGLSRVEIEMPRPEMHSIAGLNRRETRQDAVFEFKRFDRTRVHRTIVRCIVAARH